MPKPRIVTALAAVALIAAAVARDSLAASPEATQGKLTTVEQEIEAGRERQRALDRKAEALRREVGHLRESLVEAAAAAQRQEDAVGGLEERLAALTAARAAKRAELGRRRAELADTLAALQRVGRLPPQFVVARPGSAIEARRSALLLGAALPVLEGRARELNHDLVELAALEDAIVSRKGELTGAREVLEKERRELDRLIRRKAVQEQRTETARAAERERMEKLAREAADLRALIGKLEEERRAREAAERTAPAKADTGQAAPERRLARLPAPLPEARPAPAPEPRPLVLVPPPARQAPALKPHRTFADARGSLPLPARGRIVRRFGQSNEFGANAQGISIETLGGAQVIAPYDGRIAFAGTYRGYGQLLIIEHGEGYHTLLAGLSRIDGTVGQWLLAGEPVGQMAEESDRKPTLYVEMRHNGEPINPLPWLAASDRRVSG